MKRLLLLLIYATNCWLGILTVTSGASTDGPIKSKNCFSLNQPNVTLTCRACNETNNKITWCLNDSGRTEDRIVCGNNSQVFHDAQYPEVYINTSDGNILLSTVRRAHGSVTFSCNRTCSDGRWEEHIISLLVEVSFKDKLVEKELDNGTWNENELGRYLCIAGRSYGNTKYSWQFNDNELNFTNATLSENSECDLEAGCEQECLKFLVSQLVPINSPEPHHALLKFSACPSDDAIDDDEYFSYVSILMFGEVSTATEGTYSFTITGNNGQYYNFTRNTTAHVSIRKTRINSNIEISVGNLNNPKVLLLSQQQSYSMKCQVDHISSTNSSATPRWLKNNNSIKQFNGSTSVGCHNTLDTYYTVETNKSSTNDYNGIYSQVTTYSSIVTLYLCDVTLAAEGHYSCNITDDDRNVTDGQVVKVTVQRYATVASDEANDTERLLIIWFTVLNGVLIMAILITLVIWCWIKHPVAKQKKHVDTVCDAGLPAYLHNSLELETNFTLDSSDALEFPFHQLEFLHLLGEGNFGCVRKARANGIIPGDDVRNIVAVKTLKDNARPSDVDDLRQELHILKKIQPHCNILNLLGYCTKPDTPLCLIIEFAAQGSLKHFLTLCKQNMEMLSMANPMANGKPSGTGYYNESTVTQSTTQPVTQSATQLVTQSAAQLVTQSTTQPVTQLTTQPVTHYINTNNNWYMYEKQVTQTTSLVDYYNSNRLPHNEHSGHTTGGLAIMDICYFLLQIATGMDHIGKMKLIHRDLAARNILIAEGYVLKIGDFGLSRNLTDKDYYRKTGRGMIPVRWMSVESLETGLHTYQSDVWSFGVVAWEILTYAEMPYGMDNFARSVKGMVQHLKSGGRLPCPPAPHGPIFYPMMTKCWAANSDDRPSFSELVVTFESQLSTILAAQEVS